MRRSIVIFLLAVILPAAVLGWMALRSAREQQIIIERQAAELLQKEADVLAASVREAILAEQRDFSAAVRRLLTKEKIGALAETFCHVLPTEWSRKAIGFALSPDGAMTCPTPVLAAKDKELGRFLWDNSSFLCSTQPALVYPVSNDVLKNRAAMQNVAPGILMDGQQEAVAQKMDPRPAGKLVQRIEYQQQRAVTPTNNDSVILNSALNPATAEFRALTAGADEGIVARFVQDKLELIFWLKPPEAPGSIYGCLVTAASFREALNGLVKAPTENGGAAPAFLSAVLDDKARPVASPGGATAEWKRPFVATEIGGMLPHWEAAVFLASPDSLANAARGFHRTVLFLIVGAIALIALGGWLVVADARRQMVLARQKTDFVSNVSHELKTPLTSIRMFAELMHARPQPAEKQSQYLRIITAESERLTRLINNVLDFAKLERRQRQFDMQPLDFHAVLARVWENQSLHFEMAGFSAKWDAAPGPYPISGDGDALAQVLVNLLSNAEKYSGERKEVELRSSVANGEVRVEILDRGIGVPAGQERRIFEAFYRAHDSLASGIQGSGLGLTLARQIAAAHGGAILFSRRDGGGSSFVLTLPAA